MYLQYDGAPELCAELGSHCYFELVDAYYSRRPHETVYEYRGGVVPGRAFRYMGTFYFGMRHVLLPECARPEQRPVFTTANCIELEHVTFEPGAGLPSSHILLPPDIDSMPSQFCP